MQVHELSWGDVYVRAGEVAEEIIARILEARGTSPPLILYGIPRGGIPAMMAVRECLRLKGFPTSITTDPEDAEIFVDDIIDSGNTKLRYERRYGIVPFLALVQPTDFADQWVSFPWERMNGEAGAEDAVVRLIQNIGDDPTREGLIETPSRVIRAYKELFAGYSMDTSKILKSFSDGACDEMVVLRDIEFCSMCEHHMLPFTGVAHIAYIPNKRVVGVSKLARLLEAYTRRLQIQERICQQVTKTLMAELQPLGAACVLVAKHLCMTCRGVNKQHSTMVTSSLEGVFRDRQEARSEFMSIIQGERHV